MLSDTKLNPKYTHNKQALQHSTARALSLGNDITAYGHSVDFLVDTWQDSTVSYVRMPAIQPAQALLDRVAETYPEAQEPSNLHTPIVRELSITDYLNTDKKRQLFREYYAQLIFMGKTHTDIMATIYEAINNH